MKILITGGAGFIGSHLVDRLRARGDELLVIDNYTTGRRDNLAEQDRLTIVEGTIAEAEVVDEAFDHFEPEMVVHAAASYKDPDNWLEDIRTNALGTAHVVRAAERHRVKRLIYFQTALCYGLHPQEQPITLSHPIDSTASSYAISKTAGEQYIALSGLDFISFRLANCYGPRNLSGPLPTFFHRLTNDQPCYCVDTRRDFVFVDDLLQVVEMAIDGKGSRGYYHISSGGDYSIKELFDAAVTAIGITLEEDVEVKSRGEDDAYTILLDPSRTCEDFGWSADTPLATGVARAVAYYQEYGIQETYTHLQHKG